MQPLPCGDIVVGGLSVLAGLLVVVVFVLGGVVKSDFHSTCTTVSTDGTTQTVKWAG